MKVRSVALLGGAAALKENKRLSMAQQAHEHHLASLSPLEMAALGGKSAMERLAMRATPLVASGAVHQSTQEEGSKTAAEAVPITEAADELLKGFGLPSVDDIKYHGPQTAAAVTMIAQRIEGLVNELSTSQALDETLSGARGLGFGWDARGLPQGQLVEVPLEELTPSERQRFLLHRNVMNVVDMPCADAAVPGEKISATRSARNGLALRIASKLPVNRNKTNSFGEWFMYDPATCSLWIRRERLTTLHERKRRATFHSGANDFEEDEDKAMQDSADAGLGQFVLFMLKLLAHIRSNAMADNDPAFTSAMGHSLELIGTCVLCDSAFSAISAISRERERERERERVCVCIPFPCISS